MNFSKINLVLKREYITRVRSKSFILSTVLTPLVMLAVGALMVWIITADSDTGKTVGLLDETGVLAQKLTAENPDRYQNLSSVGIDSVKNMVLDGNLDAYIVLRESSVTSTEPLELIYGSGSSLIFTEGVRSDIRDVIQEERLNRANVSDEVKALFENLPKLTTHKLTAEGETEDDKAGFMSIVGFILGLLIFIGLFGYGAILMRSVIEEKTSRIVEIITSSIKPIELLIGKVAGVCLLGFTQFAIWVLMYVGISAAAVPIIGLTMQNSFSEIPDTDEAMSALSDAGFDPSSLDLFSINPMIFVYFFLFFILGFFMYAALFAAVGSAVDSEQDTQQFMPILMIPIMVGYFFNTRVMVDPDAPMSVFASIFPLTSPINMVTRIAATDVPFWQILASLAALVLTFFGLMWISAKIYRVGILMYGKKAKWSDLVKWVRQS